MGATTDQLVPVVDPANRAVRLAASVCVWDMSIPLCLLSLYGRVLNTVYTRVRDGEYTHYTVYSFIVHELAPYSP